MTVVSRPTRGRVVRSRLTAAVLAAALLTACSGGDEAGTSTTQSTASSEQQTQQASSTPSSAVAPSVDHGDAMAVGDTLETSGSFDGAAETDYTVTVKSTSWVLAMDVHGDYSDGWVPTAKVYMAAEIEYVAGAGEVLFSTADWTFLGDDGTDGIPQIAGGGGPEEKWALPAAGEVVPGATVTGKVYFGFPAEVSGVLSYTTLTGGTVGEWSVPAS